MKGICLINQYKINILSCLLVYGSYEASREANWNVRNVSYILLLVCRKKEGRKENFHLWLNCSYFTEIDCKESCVFHLVMLCVCSSVTEI